MHHTKHAEGRYISDEPTSTFCHSNHRRTPEYVVLAELIEKKQSREFCVSDNGLLDFAFRRVQCSIALAAVNMKKYH